MSEEYPIAMKLMAGRQKNDLSDIVDILTDQEERGEAFIFNRIKKAVIDLYDSYNIIPKNSRMFY